MSGGERPGLAADGAARSATLEAAAAGHLSDAELLEIAGAHLQRTREVSDRFFRDRADDVSNACWAMAKRFHRGGRLLVFAEPGPGTSDAYHVSVEFVHPVLVGKRALPAVALDREPASRIRQIGDADDIALGISASGEGPAVLEALEAGRGRGLLTVGLAGGSGGAMARLEPDHLFAVNSDDPLVVQEVHETLYHVLWELVHVFFDHRGLS